MLRWGVDAIAVKRDLGNKKPWLPVFRKELRMYWEKLAKNSKN